MGELGSIELADLDYELPRDLIAQAPLAERDGARLCVVDRARGEVRHARVRDLPELIPPALVVVNDTRVRHARLHGVKPTGGRAELLLLERVGEAGPRELWRCLGRASKGLPVGTVLAIAGGRLRAEVTEVEPRDGEGAAALRVALEARDAGSIEDVIERHGHVPLPPYIRRADADADRDRYQTVFAREPGAAAAPTAGLHLSYALLAELRARGHELAAVTLHVGLGTFAPVKARRLAEHVMHREGYEVPAEAARAFAAARAARRPVLAVGTTVARTLESAVDATGDLAVGRGATDLFIRPPYRFAAVDALFTNFHLPRSTLLALVMAFGGVGLVRRAYAEAVRARYRFFSYGDAMLLV